MSEHFSIRRLIPDEWQAFSAMRLRSLKEDGASLGVAYEQEANKPEQVWRNWLGNPNKPVFGLFDDQVLIGTAGLFFDEKEKTVYMGGTYIVPAYRGRGLSAMFSTIRIDYAVDNFLTSDILRAAHRVGNAVAIAASRKAGLIYQSQEVREWPDGTQAPQDWYCLDIGTLRRQRLSRDSKDSISENCTIRALNPNDWQEFSAIRLESLRAYPQFFSSSHAKESAQTKEQWQGWLTQESKCVFGLYHEKNLIGITAAFTWKDDPAQDTGVLAASYIKPEHQGKGLSAKLYQARIDWAIGYPQWKKLIVSHREGNESSCRTNQKWGFIYTGKKPKTWPDGIIADEHVYELDLEVLRRKKSCDTLISARQDVS